MARLLPTTKTQVSGHRFLPTGGLGSNMDITYWWSTA